MKESQLLPYEHSDIKVKLLKLYLEKYISILSLSKTVEEIHVHDLFCGEGLYPNGKEGSPLIILRILKDIYYRRLATDLKLPKFVCSFNDINADKIAKLKSSVDGAHLNIDKIASLDFSNSDYQQKKTIVANSANSGKNRKTFIFIDPYGYKDVTVTDIEELLKGGNSEVLLFLPTQFMYRFEKNATPETLWNFINDLSSSEQWDESKSGIDFIHKIRDGFRKKLDGRHFVDSFIISRESNQFFALFFFTSSLYGFEKFLEAKWEMDEEEGRGWTPTQTSVNLFSSVETKPNTDKFEELLKNYLKEARSNIDVHRFTIEHGHLVTHTVSILKQLQADQKLTITSPGNTQIRKGAFYISWNSVKDGTPLCFIKSKPVWHNQVLNGLK